MAETVSPGYTFDAMGNRLSRTDSSAGTTNYSYNAANMLTASTGASASTYTPDADGDTLSGGGRTCAWDAQNRLASCTLNGQTTTFTYGADGLRRSQTAGGVTTYYVYDGPSMVREMQKNVSGVLVPTATYLTGPRGPEYRRDDTRTETDGQGHTFGVTRWYVYDGLGSVVGEVDPLGDLTCSNEYDVYGAVRGRTGTATTAHGFVGGLGHLSDASTGLIYMRARYYDPIVGRFASEDAGKDGVNWFAYVADNPVNSIDVSGEFTQTELLAAIAFLGPWLAKKTLDRLVTWAENKGLTVGDLVKWLQRDGQNKIDGGEDEAAEGGEEEQIGEQMDDDGAPEEVEGQKTMEEGVEDIVEGYTEKEAASFIDYVEFD